MGVGGEVRMGGEGWWRDEGVGGEMSGEVRMEEWDRWRGEDTTNGRRNTYFRPPIPLRMRYLS